MRLRHVGIVTQDIEAMISYYQKLGLVISSDTKEEVRIVKLGNGKTQIELLQYQSQSENVLRQKGISHLAFTVDPDGNWLELVEEAKDALG